MIKSFIEFFGNNPFWVGIASICSILGLLLSIILLFLASSIKKKIKLYSDTTKFNENREHNAQILIGYKDSIYKDNLLDAKIISDIQVEIHRFSSYNNLRTLSDRINIFFINRHLKKPLSEINNVRLCNQLAYFISRYGRGMDFYE